MISTEFTTQAYSEGEFLWSVLKFVRLSAYTEHVFLNLAILLESQISEFILNLFCI